jgi:hypothetical protein
MLLGEAANHPARLVGVGAQRHWVHHCWRGRALQWQSKTRGPSDCHSPWWGQGWCRRWSWGSSCSCSSPPDPKRAREDLWPATARKCHQCAVWRWICRTLTWRTTPISTNWGSSSPGPQECEIS